MSAEAAQSAEKIRLDKWLWHARFFKTRTLAAKVVSEKGVRVNAARVSKPGRSIGPGDVLTFVAGDRVRIAKVLACGTRRGPAPEAQSLYEDLSPPEPPKEDRAAHNPRFEGRGRPTKRDRRALDLKGGGALE